MRHLSALLCCVLPACLALPATAQESPTIEEIISLFNKQAEVFRAAEDAGGFDEVQRTGEVKTRGLTLVTVQDVVAEPAAPTQPAAPQAADSSGVTVSTDSVPTPARDPNAPLKVAADSKPLVFGRLAPELQINLKITFGYDSAALSDSEKPKLAAMCAAMQQSAINTFRIVGHTDIAGSDEYNERLSIMRAKEVARHLTEDCGIDPGRLETIGMGERSLYDPDNPRGEENRRVEFQALG